MNNSRPPSVPPSKKTAKSDRPISFAVLVAAFGGHLTAWIGYVAMRVSNESYATAHPWVTNLLGFAFAATAVFCALILGRALPRGWRLGFTLVSLIVVLGSGITELFGLVFSDADSPLADVMAVVFVPMVALPYIGELVYPLILSAAVIWAVRAQESPAVSEHEALPTETIRSQSTDPAAGRVAFIVCYVALAGSAATNALLTAAFFLPVLGADDEGWGKEYVWLTAAGIAGAIGIVGVFRRFSAVETSTPISTTFEVIVLLALVFAHQSTSLSAAQAVYSDSSGIGGTLLWIFVACMFPLATVILLLMTSIITFRSRSASATRTLT